MIGIVPVIQWRMDLSYDNIIVALVIIFYNNAFYAHGKFGRRRWSKFKNAFSQKRKAVAPGRPLSFCVCVCNRELEFEHSCDKC